MIKTLRKNVFLLFIVLCTIILSAFIINKNITYNKDHDVNLRTVTLEENQVNAESYFEAFDEYEITTEDLTTTFDGVSTFNLSDFDDIDNISDGDVGESISIRYRSSFDYETGITTLTVLLVGEEDFEIVDTVYGLALMDTETGEVDIAFDFDGETIFLSELRNAGLLDEVGLFKEIAKLAVNAVVNKVKNNVKEVVNTVTGTVKAAAKVLTTYKGLIGSVCTVAACAVVGAACSWIPGGQIVTVGCAAIAGAVIGGIGFNLSAKAAQQEDFTITNNDIGYYTALGCTVGSTVAVCNHNAMNNYREASKNRYCFDNNDNITNSNTANDNSFNQTEELSSNKINKNDLPENVKKAYDGYDNVNWKNSYPDQERYTKAGETWKNKYNQLPTQDANGNSITYKAYDIHASPDGVERDSLRFVHGSDGKTYYTNDHYKTFYEIIEEILK